MNTYGGKYIYYFGNFLQYPGLHAMDDADFKKQPLLCIHKHSVVRGCCISKRTMRKLKNC